MVEYIDIGSTVLYADAIFIDEFCRCTLFIGQYFLSFLPLYPQVSRILKIASIKRY